MTSVAYVLDAGVLGQASHPRRNPELDHWFEEMSAAGACFIIPEIADYEVRRELLRCDKAAGLRRLDDLKSVFDYMPITTPIMLLAAKLWADIRKRGQPTAPNHALDGDVILAAQALAASAAVVTDNVNHLSRYVDAYNWRDIEIPK